MDERRDVLKRIPADPAIFGGKPIIPGMRISVAYAPIRWPAVHTG